MLVAAVVFASSVHRSVFVAYRLKVSWSAAASAPPALPASVVSLIPFLLETVRLVCLLRFASIARFGFDVASFPAASRFVPAVDWTDVTCNQIVRWYFDDLRLDCSFQICFLCILRILSTFLLELVRVVELVVELVVRYA